ncbi:MAG: sulfite exporter TauE/SafE family protein [Anaerolineae bacterium]|jgi:uncharacterized membrane protein YfcA
MDLDLASLAVPVIVFIATVVRSTFGFGGALVAMPLLTMVVGIQTATPLVALIVNTNSIAMLLSSWREVRIGSAWRLVVSSLLGIPVGLLFLTEAYEGIVKAGLAVVIIVFSLYNLFKPQLAALVSQRTAYLFGFFAGILGGAYNASGPLVVTYGTLRNWPADSFRATLQGYFFPIGLLIVVSHGLAGLWTAEVVRLYVISLPVVLLALLVGRRINHSIPAGRFEQFVSVLLIVIATVLLVP